MLAKTPAQRVRSLFCESASVYPLEGSTPDEINNSIDYLCALAHRRGEIFQERLDMIKMMDPQLIGFSPNKIVTTNAPHTFFEDDPQRDSCIHRNYSRK